MLILGVESSCDETGVALYEAGGAGLLAHALHSQVAMHEAYGGVVPELASRDHIRRLVPLVREVCARSGRALETIGGVGYTEGPGLAGALLVGASFARAFALAQGVPCLGVHHLEAHLLSPLLARPAPEFPFIALLVSGGHTQLMRVDGVGEYALLGETLDDAAGEAFDKTAKLLGLGYPGGPALSRLAMQGRPGRFKLPRPLLASGLEFSFSGLKTAVLLLARESRQEDHPDIARAFVDAVMEVLVAKCARALAHCGLRQLVVAGGVGANAQLREALGKAGEAGGFRVFYPEPELCTDNGAMVAHAAALRFAEANRSSSFSVRPRWPLGAAG